MMMKVFSCSLLLGGALFLGSGLHAAEEAPQAPPAGRQFNGRGPAGAPGMGMRRNPDMMTARLVMKELRAYQTNPTPENLAALEKALNEAMQKDTASRKAMLEKALADLEKNQQKRAADFLEKVKKGEFKLPQRPPRGERKRPARGEK